MSTPHPLTVGTKTITFFSTEPLETFFCCHCYWVRGYINPIHARHAHHQPADTGFHLRSTSGKIYVTKEINSRQVVRGLILTHVDVALPPIDSWPFVAVSGTNTNPFLRSGRSSAEVTHLSLVWASRQEFH